ncbi:pyridoxal phosphate-dependent aminotransferase [Natronospira bacteriovora]|uniref:Aminotransferase n=1 Tax=Natronospira bacteriovora TaxID=3069753 RepID=A0ABU0W4R4_9GAMM|nr:pyridoxal phosphate-dependent aminotransferase [Natronospira sp. AB-CW4]MDQ2068939.1 pyridoxal phosphate-dependent aminotransferase [Natronospira sp. AB-CW4]
MLEPIRSHRVADLVQSDIRAMTQRCVELGGVNLGQGVCDTPPPNPVVAGVQGALDRGANIYTRFDGVGRLRKALAGKFERHNGLKPDPDCEIVVTIGSTGAFAATLMALCNPGDRLLLLEPYYGYHLNTARVAQLETELVPLQGPELKLDAGLLEEKARGARALVLNTPGNPSGRVFTREELEAIADICRRHNLLCITDEIYEYFLYDGRKHISIATLPGMWERTVTITGYSKTFSITGWRIGAVAAHRDLAAPIGLVNDLYYVCAPSPLQYAVADGINTLADDFYRDLAQEYQDKRDRFCGVLKEAGLTPAIPEGAYYVLADIRRLGCDNARDAAMKLLEEAGIASIPGSAFFADPRGEQLVRFCFAKDEDTLNRGCEQLSDWARKQR